MAVGNYATYTNGSSGEEGLLETLSGGTWTPTEAPLPANADPIQPFAYFYVAACPTVGSCIAVGTYSDSDGDGHVGVETLSGGQWTSGEAPLPADATDIDQMTFVYGLACPTTGTCIAVGSYTDAGAGSGGLIETLSGRVWTPTEAPLPESGSGASVDSIACPSSSSCVAVGDFYDTSKGEQGLSETLSGGVWTPTEPPLPATALDLSDLGSLDLPGDWLVSGGGEAISTRPITERVFSRH